MYTQTGQKKENKNPKLNTSKINEKNNNFYNRPTIQDTIKSDKDNKRSQNNFSFNFDHINILGIDLFSDDILLILLIYFLYTQGITDIYLFIVLILLLLS